MYAFNTMPAVTGAPQSLLGLVVLAIARTKRQPTTAALAGTCLQRRSGQGT